MTIRWSLVLVFLVQGLLMAQDEESPKIKWSSEIRLRSETDGRDFNNKTDINSYTYLRARVGAAFEPLEHVHGFIQIQDSRVFGKEPNTLSNTANLDLHQAYVTYEGFLWKKLDLKLGRMEAAYGDQRLVGAVGWSNVGRSFDGSIVTIRWTEKFKLDCFAFDLQENSAPASVASPPALAGNVSDEEDMYFSGLYGMYKPSERYAVDFYLMAEMDGTEKVSDGKDTLARLTLGTYSRGEFGPWAYKTELAYQLGKNGENDISAYMLTGSLSYTMREAGWKPAITCGADFLSGDNKADDKITSFNTLYGTNHKYYGYMDYFVDVPSQTKGLGLLDAMAKIKLVPHEKLTLMADAHHFRSAKKSTASGSIFGTEIDLVGVYRFNKHFAWESGASLFVPGKLMKSFFGSDDVGLWSYSMTTFTF